MGNWPDNSLGVPQVGGIASGSRSRSPSPSGTRRDSEPAIEYTASVSHESHSDQPRRPYADASVTGRSPTPDSSVDFSAPRFPGEGRSNSPTRIAGKVQGPRPIVESMRKNQYPSDNSLRSSHAHGLSANNGMGRSPLILANDFDRKSDEDEDRPPARPSAKALGKRRAAAKTEREPDPARLSPGLSLNVALLLAEFDPDDIFKTDESQDKHSPDTTMEDSVRQYWEQKHPTRYLYDAARERQQALRENEAVTKVTRPTRTSSLHTSGGAQ